MGNGNYPSTIRFTRMTNTGEVMNTKRVETLSQAQKELLTAKRNEWMAIGLSTEPAGRDAAEAAARTAYRTAGLPEPKIVIWMDNPLHGAIAQGILRSKVGAQVGAQVWAQVGDQVRAQVWAQVGDQVRAQVGAQVRAQVRAQVGAQVGAQVRAQVWAQVGDQVWAQVWDQVWAQVGAQVGAQVWDQVGDQVGAQVWAQVRAQVWAQVWAQVRAQVWAQVGDQVGAQVGAQVRDQVRAQVRDWSSGCAWGQHDAWLSFYDTFDELGIVDGAERIRGLVGVARNCGWWWPLAGAVVLCERTNRILRDPQGRLHCADGPALSYPGDFHIWCWHGTPVPQDLIETPWDVTRIMAESNTEVRRCAIEKMGWDQFVVAADLTLADESDDPANPGQKLRLYDVPRKVLDLPVRVLVASNATVERNGERHTFGLTVPTDCTTAMSAAGWTFDLTEGEYAELARAT